MSLAENRSLTYADEAIAELNTFEGFIDSAIDLADQVAIVNKESAEEAINFALDIRKLKKKIEARKLEITSNARKYVNAINTLAKGYTTRLDNAVDDIEHKLFLWKQDEAKKSEVSSFFCEELGTDFALETIQDTSVLRAAGGTAYERDVWKYEILDYREVPIDYLEVNDGSVKLAMRNGIRNIPGLRIYKETKTTLRSV